MLIKIPFSDLPDARDWEDGQLYDVSVRQVSHDKDGVTLEVANHEEDALEEEDGEESFSKM